MMSYGTNERVGERRALVWCGLLWCCLGLGCGSGDLVDGSRHDDPEETLRGAVGAPRAGVSPLRASTEPFRQALRRALPGADPELRRAGTVLDARVPVGRADASRAPVWTADELAAGFALARDRRGITLESMSDFPRRPSFLYPDDGCYARAERMAFELEQAGYARPAKVFVFGDLQLWSPNSQWPIFWWYHVAPAVRVADEMYVLDPSIDPDAPILMTSWATRLESLGAEVSVCNAFAYFPDSQCDGPPPASLEEAAMDNQEGLLALEWDRQRELGRDPLRVLGEEPPWAAPP